MEISRVKSNIRTISFLFFCLISLRPAHSAGYYFSADGNDAMDGLSDATAWKSLQKAASITLNPGDTILLRRGDTWTGECLFPRGNGHPGAPITIVSLRKRQLEAGNKRPGNVSTDERGEDDIGRIVPAQCKLVDYSPFGDQKYRRCAR